MPIRKRSRAESKKKSTKKAKKRVRKKGSKVQNLSGHKRKRAGAKRTQEEKDEIYTDEEFRILENELRSDIELRNHMFFEAGRLTELYAMGPNHRWK